MNRRALILLACLLGVLVAAPAASASSSPSSKSGAQHRTVLEFDVMTPVTEPFTGPANAIRGVPGGGAPWEIDSARGELRSDGRIEVRVDGLVLARRPPVAPELQGTNPVATFKAIVSCMTIAGGAATTVNVSTDPAPATPTGDARIEGKVDLPSPCIAPIVFVTSPTGAWFSVTGS